MPNNILKIPSRLALPVTLPNDLPSLVLFLQRLIRELQQHAAVTSAIINNLVGADTLVNRPLTPPNGSLFYATDAAHLYVYTGTWITLI